ncbi:hypothetical protein L7F22_016514 [Adiantum nelumboides]|nr:hypothetical protein [Adiantum nelumboides]
MWEDLKTNFCDTFCPRNSSERALDQPENLELQSGETFAELMTRTKALVEKLSQPLGDFVIRKWIEKALPRANQLKLKESPHLGATLEEFKAAAKRIEDARLLFLVNRSATPESSVDPAPTTDPVAAIRRKLEALCLQPTLTNATSKSPQMEALARLQREVEELRMSHELRTQVWCIVCHTAGNPPQECPQRTYCHFCEKTGHVDKDCYYLKGLRQIQQ